MIWHGLDGTDLDEDGKEVMRWHFSKEEVDKLEEMQGNSDWYKIIEINSKLKGENYAWTIYRET